MIGKGINWNSIHTAVQTVRTGDPKRIDGDGYKVYRIDGIVRVDIDEDKVMEEAEQWTSTSSR